jgi:glycine cleavage system H protein
MRDEARLRFTPTHEWVDDSGGILTIGISKFAVDQLTDLIHIELPKVGAKLESGKALGEIESVKAVSDIYAPVSGEVVEVNGDVAGDVQILARDPYESGWLIKLRPAAGFDPSALLDHKSYVELVASDAH